MRLRVLGSLVFALGLIAACDRERAPTVADAAPIITSSPIDASVAVEPKQSAPPEAPLKTDPFGTARSSSKAGCRILHERHVADKDVRTSFVDGDDLLAIVNRSPQGSLAPDWAPSDLVDLQSGKPLTSSECEKYQCLRREAAAALAELMGEMKKLGFPGKVESAYRSYGAQCGTFANWARKSTFCEATEQSALPGHSQHQLGTTVDLFTEEWAQDERGVFREGFGCTPAGRFLRERAIEFGFVMPYPIHPDDRHPRQKCVVRWDIPVNINPRTGYRFEHWHIRYVGKDAAARFKKALEASGVGTPNEITVEQWLRQEKGIARRTNGDAELPVCDGCNCGACSTLTAVGESACDKKAGALHLDEHGLPAFGDDKPSIESAQRGKARKWKGRVVEVKLDVPVGIATQPPVVGLDAAGYATGSTFEKLSPYPDTEPRAYPPLSGAWVVGVEPIPNDTGVAYPWRAAISLAVNGQIYNRANVLLPALPRLTTVKIPIPSGVSKVKVTLLKDGVAETDSEHTVTFD